MLGTYLITGANAPNLYEIHHASVLLNPTLDTENLEILGIGFGYQDTVKLVQRMLEERFCP